jgi:lipoprotein signal peptidase
VFNVADASITTGVLMLLIFQKKFFAKKESPENITGIIPQGDSSTTS